jgi:hypothetical protein
LTGDHVALPTAMLLYGKSAQLAYGRAVAEVSRWLGATHKSGGHWKPVAASGFGRPSPRNDVVKSL